MFRDVFSAIYKAWAKILKFHKLPRAILSSAFLLLTVTMVELALFGAALIGFLLLRNALR